MNAYKNMIQTSSKIVDIDPELCTGCGRCKAICPVGAITGELHHPHSINENLCVLCGQCVQTCCGYQSQFEDYPTSREARLIERGMVSTTVEPLFAAHYRGDVHRLIDALADTKVHTLVQCAPAVRVALAEEFGLEYGALTPGKLAGCLERLGFDRIYDTNFAADVTIMEEGAELLSRITSGENLPMFTSCCPGWVRYMEQRHPDLLHHLSSCKSPQQMAGALFKTYGAQCEDIDASRIFSVSIMPCTCKKAEIEKPGMASSGYQDVDLVLTTRELAAMIKYYGIDFHAVAERGFDHPLGDYTGAGTIFGATGGVMEAALRSSLEQATGVPLPNLDLKEVRGGEGVRMVEVAHGDVRLKVGVVAGINHVEPLLEDIRAGRADFHFVEVMCCPLGCVSGGGQPKTLFPGQQELAVMARKKGLYQHDKDLPKRKSHENEGVQKLYREFLGAPLGEKSHHLLHIHHGGGGHE